MKTKKLRQIQQYRPFWPFRNGTFNTVFTNVYRWRIPLPAYQRYQVPTPDSDALALDVASIRSPYALIMVHGLEGDSGSSYIRGMVRAAHQKGYDALCLNLRGCGGGLPLQPVTYHSGKTTDLAATIRFIQNRFSYEALGLVGFSLGGNLVLKYAGEKGKELPSLIKAICTQAMPFDLARAVKEIDRPGNWPFKKHFIYSLKNRARKIKERWPQINVSRTAIKEVNSLQGFDEVFTAPLNGFEDAMDYYLQSSSAQFLSGIDRPSCLITAIDDPFIPGDQIPYSTIADQQQLTLITTQYGGHLGYGDLPFPMILCNEEACCNFMQAYLH